MDMNTLYRRNMEIVILAFLWIVAQAAGEGLYVVDDFGAVGDGETDDSQAFLKAWEATCGDTGYPNLIIPGGKTYLISQTSFTGPCKSGIHVQILGNLVAPATPWKPKGNDRWISFNHVNNLLVDGYGTIDGQGSAWWSCKECSEAPYLFGIMDCNDFTLASLTFTNAQGKHVTAYESVGVTIEAINIVAPKSSPNTDGIYISKCQQVVILGPHIESGDDCIAIGGGTSAVNITNAYCGPGHGISIGSLGRDGSEEEVQDVHVLHCQFNKTQNGVRIKTWQGGSGFVKGITFVDINVTSVAVPIHIDQYYPSSSRRNQSSAVQISDVSFTKVVGTTSRHMGVDIACSESVECRGITLQDIDIQSDSGKSLTPRCANAQARTSGTISPAVTCNDYM